MPSQVIAPFGTATITVAASARVAAFSAGQYDVNQVVGFPNAPSSLQTLFNSTGGFTSSPFTVAGQAVVNAGAQSVLVNVGASASVYERLDVTQPTPGVLNASGTLTAALILTGIVTSTTGAAVVGTLDTGTVMEAALSEAAGDAFDWSVINTGGANAFTVTAAAGHTVVGSGVVALTSTGRFLTTKTATNTFITYRVS